MNVRALFAAACIALALPCAAAPVTHEEVRSLLNAQRCAEARLKIQNASNRDDFLRTAEGKAYYAASLCYSPPADLNLKDIDNAVLHAAGARRELAPEAVALKTWLDGVEGNCRTLRLQLARGKRDGLVAIYSGKIMGGCQISPSPVFLPPAGDPNTPAGVLAAYDWVPIVPPLEAGQAPAPDETFLAARRKAHKTSGGKPARAAVCAPFVAVSAEQDPAFICHQATRFLGYFRDTFGGAPPQAWITIHHYADPDLMRAHIRAHKGPECTGTLGYYDWRRQQLVFRAPPGSAGTLNHELTHALVFWDFPLAPRWLEEGMAALHEHTGEGYLALPNPWREDLLRRHGKPRPGLEDFKKLVGMSAMEFEHQALNATLARAYLMGMQRCGTLPPLYRDIRLDEADTQADIPLHADERPRREQVDRWLERVQARACP